MVNPQDLIEFKEETEEQQQRESSIKEIVLRQIKKVGDICSEEMTGGYWQEKPIKIGGGIVISKEYHQDQREAYCIAVEFITDLVYPYADKQLKDYLINNEKEISDIKEKLKNKKKIFREINIFFQRDDFFSNSDSIDE